jgi:hypothetical protein
MERTTRRGDRAILHASPRQCCKRHWHKSYLAVQTIRYQMANGMVLSLRGLGKKRPPPPSAEKLAVWFPVRYVPFSPFYRLAFHFSLFFLFFLFFFIFPFPCMSFKLHRCGPHCGVRILKLCVINISETETSWPGGWTIYKQRVVESL